MYVNVVPVRKKLLLVRFFPFFKKKHKTIAATAQTGPLIL